MKSLLKMGLTLLTLASVFTIGPAYADKKSDIESIKQELSKSLPTAAGATIRATPMEGIYEVIAGGEVIYTSKDAQFVILGDLINMKTRENLTENAKGLIRKQAVDDLGEENLLVYTPKGEVKHTVTIFTDIYCPYCRRLHSEMDEYMKKGIKVRYVFVPFKGAKSVEDSISVWCAKDRTKAMDMAKSGKTIEKKTCDNPIQKHQQLATELGIRGTPAIMLESGKLLPGYVPIGKLVTQLDQ